MRLIALLAAPILLATPAMAQGRSCEVDAAGKYGEVIVIQTAGKPELKVYWYVERREGVGEENDHFARPRLQLTFHIAADETVTGPTVSTVSITRYSAPDVGRAPPLSDVTVQATFPDGKPVSWNADDNEEGHLELAKRLNANWPNQLTLNLLVADTIVASSSFDLGLKDLAMIGARKKRGACD